MSQILLDNIGFSLQRMGGLSVVWKALIEALLRSDLSFECLEYPGCMNNEVRRNLSGYKVVKFDPMSINLERYINPTLNCDSPFIFHSSLYRTTGNPNAINITTVHDFTYEYYRKGLAQWVHSWQKNKSIRNADMVVCISESTKRDILQFLPDVPESKIRVIHNGVSTDYSVVESTKYDSLGEYVVFVGARQPYKQFYYLVECLKDLPYKLAIVGGSLNKEEVAYLNSILGESKYQHMGYLSNKNLNFLYNQAVCLAYPSAYEGFGIPVLEAQRAGCPVIAYRASSIPEVIGKTPLLLNELSTDEFVKKINILKSDRDRNDIISEGLKNSKRFSWTKMGDEYICLYKELLQL